MTRNFELGAVIPMLPTPFRDNLSLDERCLEQLVERVSGEYPTIALLGFGAECLQLDNTERRRVLGIARASSPATTRIIVGCTAATAAEGMLLARDADQSGADVIMIAPPLDIVTRATAAEFIEQCAQSLHSASLMVQDAPLWSGASLGSEVIAGLKSKFPHTVRYAKPEQLPFGNDVHALTDIEDLAVYTGLGGTSFLDGLALGAAGVIPFIESSRMLSSIATEYPGDGAIQAYQSLLPLLTFQMQTLGHAIYTSKLILGWIGFDLSPATRIPIEPPCTAAVDLLRHHAKTAGILVS